VSAGRSLRPERRREESWGERDVADPVRQGWADLNNEWGDALDLLPPGEREVLFLSLQDWTLREIAVRQGSSYSAVRRALASAKRRLRQRLAREGSC
jgi:RNA polymerase sigma factor (sigma-70 family)